MAKALERLPNGLLVKYLVRPKKYFLFAGSYNIKINGEWQAGFGTQQDCAKVGRSLSPIGSYQSNNWGVKP